MPLPFRHHSWKNIFPQRSWWLWYSCFLEGGEVLPGLAPAGQLVESFLGRTAILCTARHAALLKVCDFVQLEHSIIYFFYGHSNNCLNSCWPPYWTYLLRYIHWLVVGRGLYMERAAIISCVIEKVSKQTHPAGASVGLCSELLLLFFQKNY